MLGLATKQQNNDGLSDGKYNSYETDIGFETIAEALNDLDTPTHL
ncbi:hypothetical protein GCM10009066_12160 [Halarchaeum salinum]|uniref:Uncharacterized protein n=2 Tax=Halarchaeum salinum TaxID=489912 RepID=A0AAV3S7Z6_9EURY